MRPDDPDEPRSLALVDDDDSYRKATVRLLRTYGWNARGHSSSVRFSSEVEHGQYDCLLIDIHMPVLSGSDLLKAIRAKGVMTPVIFVSAYELDAVNSKVAADLAQGFLTKPCGLEEFLNTIDRVCEHPSGRD